LECLKIFAVFDISLELALRYHVVVGVRRDFSTVSAAKWLKNQIRSLAAIFQDNDREPEEVFLSVIFIAISIFRMILTPLTSIVRIKRRSPFPKIATMN
jgi:hypothetical protein